MRRHLSSLMIAVVLMAPGAALGDWPGGLGKHKGKFWKRDKVRRELQLDEDKVRNLEEIFTRNQNALTDLEADVKKKRADLETLLTDEAADDQQILAGVDLLEQARARLGKARVTMLLQMRRVLTPEQREKLHRLADDDD